MIRGFTVEQMGEIADYVKFNSVKATCSKFRCSENIVAKACLMFGVPRVVEKPSLPLPKQKSKQQDQAEAKPTAAWQPPSMAAPQHQHFIGRPI